MSEFKVTEIFLMRLGQRAPSIREFTHSPVTFIHSECKGQLHVVGPLRPI